MPIMTEKEYRCLATNEGTNRAAWEYYARWLAQYREINDEDERGDIELIPQFEKWCNRKRRMVNGSFRDN